MLCASYHIREVKPRDKSIRTSQNAIGHHWLVKPLNGVALFFVLFSMLYTTQITLTISDIFCLLVPGAAGRPPTGEGPKTAKHRQALHLELCL
jgi:hypothetical protein